VSRNVRKCFSPRRLLFLGVLQFSHGVRNRQDLLVGRSIVEEFLEAIVGTHAPFSIFFPVEHYLAG
jgi:hypothetical protein